MIHSGQLKSGPWLLAALRTADHDDPVVWGEEGPQQREDEKQASRWYTADVAVRPDAMPPGKRAEPRPVHHNPAPSQPPPDAPWVKADWRNGNGGAFHSDVRPPMSSDIPHPSEVLAPNDKRLHALSQGEDPVHDPWNVLGGTGQSFEDLVGNQMGHMQQATPEQNYEGRVWYRAAHEGTKDLSDKTIGNHPKTVAIMSALSPKTDWDENVEKGHHFLTHYTGDPNDPNFILPGMQGGVNKAKAIWHDPEGAHKQILSGPKTQAFASNILDPTPMREARPGEHDDAGYYKHPTNPHSAEPDWRLQPDQDSTMDTHHVRMGNNRPGESLGGMLYDTPAYFNKKISVNGKKFDPSYDLHARANWEATRRLNAMQADPERHLTPKQSQAVAWTKFKHDVDTDPDKKKHMQPEPGVQPKSMGPLTNPIPRYQKERDPEWWDDPRRPHVDLRQTPNWYRRPAHVANTANNGSIWGKMLGDYIARNPQHPSEASAPVPPQKVTPLRRLKPRRPNAPRREHNPRKSSWDRWYTADYKDDQGAGGMPGGGIGGASGTTPGVGTPYLPASGTGGSGYSDAAPFAGTFNNQYTQGTGGQWAMSHPPGFGGHGGGGSPGTPGGAHPGGPASVVPGGAGSVPLVKNPDGSYTSSDPAWAHLINRESGGHNIIQSPGTHDVNSGGNEAYGIFQITPGTWSSHGGQGSVYNSTPEQQAQVAADIIRKNPSGSDWGAGMSGRENASALSSGLTPLPGV